MGGNNKGNRRRFGSVRLRSSGRWQARYLGPDGLERGAPFTFASEREAERWLILIESEILRGDWMAPEAAETVLDDYAPTWIRQRKLGLRTRELYRDLYRLNIQPYLGRLALGSIKPATIRTWRRRGLDDGRPESQMVKAYRLLRAIMNTALREDEIIRANPCRIKGYGSYETPERPTATVPQVYALAGAVPVRYAALIVVAAFSGLRWGELAALRRCDVDVEVGTVRVPRSLTTSRAGLAIGPTKTPAGVRVVALPVAAVEMLREHFEAGFVGDDPEDIVFTGAKGALLRSCNFRRATRWDETVKAVGLPAGFHFHDLRHTGNTLAAASGASTRELMHRMGHASVRAAIIYQHATSERDREIAAGMDRRIARATGQPKGDRDGGKARNKSKKKNKNKRRDDGDDGSAGIPVTAS